MTLAEEIELLRRAVNYGLGNGKRNMIAKLGVLNVLLAKETDYRRLQAVAEAAEAKIRAEQASKWSERGYAHEPETENLVIALRAAGYLKEPQPLSTNQGEQP